MKASGKIWILFDTVRVKQTKPLSTVEVQKVILGLKIQSRRRYLIWTPGWEKWLSIADFLSTEQEYFATAPSPNFVNTDSQDSAEYTHTEVEEHQASRPVLTDTIPQEKEAEQIYTEIIASVKSETPKATVGYYYEDFSADNIDINAKAKVIKLPEVKTAKDAAKDFKSRAVRHEFKIEVTLVTKNGRYFRSFSKNISTSGTMLEDEIPKEFLNTQFDLIIVNKFEKDPQKGRLHFQGKIVGDYTDPRRLTFIDPDRNLVKRLETLLSNYLSQQKKSVS